MRMRSVILGMGGGGIRREKGKILVIIVRKGRGGEGGREVGVDSIAYQLSKSIHDMVCFSLQLPSLAALHA